MNFGLAHDVLNTDRSLRKCREDLSRQCPFPDHRISVKGIPLVPRDCINPPEEEPRDQKTRSQTGLVRHQGQEK